MLELFLIRHGKTYGNTLGRYIGVTDEGLCEEGKMEIGGIIYPKADIVIASPMRRCLETAFLIYPDRDVIQLENFRECDFGVFENKNYLELQGESRYQAWVDSGCTLPIPEGEDTQKFRQRCREGFVQAVDLLSKSNVKRAALVVHGGTIMSILEAYGEPAGEFYRWQVKNGHGYRVTLDEDLYQREKKVSLQGVEKL